MIAICTKSNRNLIVHLPVQIAIHPIFVQIAILPTMKPILVINAAKNIFDAFNITFYDRICEKRPKSGLRSTK